MKIREVSIAGYRSLRGIRFPVGQLTVFVGANGVGKTNLYRALQLLQASAAGTLAREIASEGGMESAVWAGKRKATSLRGSSCRSAWDRIPTETGQSSFDYDVEVGVVHSYADRGRVPAARPRQRSAWSRRSRKRPHLSRRAARPLNVLERKGPRATAIDDDGRKHALGTESARFGNRARRAARSRALRRHRTRAPGAAGLALLS